MNVISLLDAQASTRPDAVALVEGTGTRRRTCTFGEFARRSRRVADQLRRDGREPGETVLLLQPVSIDLYILVAGVLRAGLVAVLPDASAGRGRLAQSCAAVSPDAVIGPTKAHALRLLDAPVRAIPHAYTTGSIPLPRTKRLRVNAGSAVPVETDHRVDVPDEAPAVVSFTSGSTGTPKALVRSHGVLHGQYRALRDAMDLRPGQVDLCALPVFVLANLGAGVTTVLPDADLGRPGRIHPAPVHEQMRRESPTRLTASPAFIERLLTKSDAWTSVQRVDTGGAPVPYSLQQRIHEVTGADVHVLYGSSEAEPIADLAHEDIRPSDATAMRHGDGLLVGRPGPHVEVRILPDRWGTPIGPVTREDLEIQSLPPGRAGEIVVAGPHVVPGYLHGTGDAENKIRVGDRVWHRTGDAGRFDAEGRLWLLGRCSERLYGGADETGTVSDAVYPLSVELAAQAVPGVHRAAALVVDERRSVVLELDDGARHKESAIAREVLQAIGGGMTSAYVVGRLPVDRRHNAKVDYGQLRNDLSHRRIVAGMQTAESPQVAAN